MKAKLFTKKLLFVALVLLLLSAAISCKKYPEGGKMKKAEKNLRGGLNEEYMKQWRVTLYEVDGVDSTSTWKKGKSPDRFSYYHVQISRDGDDLGIETEVISLKGSLSGKNSVLVISSETDSFNAINCYRTNVCERNIFLPEGQRSTDWQILQLDYSNVKLTHSGKRKYVISMEYADEE